MIASLPMYLRPETKAAHDRYWHAIGQILRAAGIQAPDHLTKDCESLDHWLAPDLILSQTCGRPYKLHLHNKVSLIGTPDYGLEGCAPGYYRSVFIMRKSDRRRDLFDFRDARFAFNDRMSQSGWAAPQVRVAKLGFQFETCVHSHGHQNSAKMVANNTADIAALDMLSWHYIQKYDDFAEDLRVLSQTPPTPGLPYICAPSTDHQAVAAAVSKAIADLTDKDQQDLHLKGLATLPPSTYLSVPNP